ncbi:MAG: ComEC/Rec2-related protein [Parcubacteria group bacterium GW2011_GWB1_57_6]|nr:MAG: ComEC/Rec2-related protein [Parcubacteria group bacterium GW2011_GWA1_56_13]KKW46979.1 MAG: ComEC/Rec2-related protein [Parcubacteria group bacterium GW2011_GWB1_57_6]
MCQDPGCATILYVGALIAVVIGFAGGVFVRSLTSGWEPAVFFVLAAGVFGAFYYFKRHIFYALAIAFCLVAALGAVRMALSESPLPTVFVAEVGQRVSYEGIVVSDPDVRDANQRVEIRVSKGNESTTMLAVAPRYPSVAVGDRVFVSGTLAIPEPFADDNGRIFRYDKYLERDGVRFMLNFAYLRVESPAPWYSLPAALARVKHAFLDGIAATLPEPHASLASGIVIGGKSGLGEKVKEDFVRSGLVQIIVLSGYNVMVVAEWVIAALALTALPRRWGAAAGAFALLMFVGIAGFSATALRAALMALIALYARATGRTYAAGRALLLVVFLMLLWNPLYLVFDPGFGLSVAATTGLIWLAPIVETFLSFMKSSFWKNAVATTLSAQIAVLPLLLYDTGNLSLVSIPANLLVMPFVPLAMGSSALAGFAGMLFGSMAPLIGIVLAFPAYLANAYLLFIARESAALPLAAFSLPPFPFWLALVAYAGLIYLASSKRFSTTLQLTFAREASM